jgi:hypothetical protein
MYAKRDLSRQVWKPCLVRAALLSARWRGAAHLEQRHGYTRVRPVMASWCLHGDHHTHALERGAEVVPRQDGHRRAIRPVHEVRPSVRPPVSPTDRCRWSAGKAQQETSWDQGVWCDSLSELAPHVRTHREGFWTEIPRRGPPRHVHKGGRSVHNTIGNRHTCCRRTNHAGPLRELSNG